jgi:pimeloyl-ACP methyl ester carboxylesterase
MAKINLKGIMVGNGVADWDVDVWPSALELYVQFNFIPARVYKNYTSHGCMSFFNGVKPDVGDNEAICTELFEWMLGQLGDLNIYDLYRYQYADGGLLKQSEEERMKEVVIGGELKTYKSGHTIYERNRWFFEKAMSPKMAKIFMDKVASTKQTILGDPISDYVNLAELRTALHIPVEYGPWIQCGGGNTLTYHLQQEASTWIYPILKANGIRALFYSGDTDGIVPLAGSRKWFKKLNWKVLKEWRPWMIVDQVKGYVVNYEGLDFATIKGVGHMAPQWSREAVLTMINAWTSGSQL